VSVAYHHFLKDQRKVVLVISNKPGAFFTRLVELSFDQILYSAQEPVVFEPLFKEDGHGFKIEPTLDDIYWGAKSEDGLPPTTGEVTELKSTQVM
jgi:hypothetical protein